MIHFYVDFLTILHFAVGTHAIIIVAVMPTVCHLCYQFVHSFKSNAVDILMSLTGAIKI